MIVWSSCEVTVFLVKVEGCLCCAIGKQTRGNDLAFFFSLAGSAKPVVISRLTFEKTKRRAGPNEDNSGTAKDQSGSTEESA